MDKEEMANRLVAQATYWYANGQALLKKSALDAGIEVPQDALEPESLLSYPSLYAFPYSWIKVLEADRHFKNADEPENADSRRRDFVASTKIPGFWNAIGGPLTYAKIDPKSPDSEKALIRLLLTQRDETDTTFGRFLATKRCDEEPEFSAEIGKVLAGRMKPKTSVRLKLHSSTRDPRGALMRGWTSHFFWLMTTNCRSQFFDAMKSDFDSLSKSMDEKLRREFGLYSHPNPPILQLREGDAFQFVPDWTGPKPRPSQLLAVKP